MLMTFEKIEAPAEPAPEHPAERAARMIKDLHLQNIKMMDDGHVFLKDGVNVNEDMRKASMEQIAMCDQIMERAKHMDPRLWEPAALILEDLKDIVANPKVLEEQNTILPEIGNYEHGKEDDPDVH